MTLALDQVLAESALCRQLVMFLKKSPSAMDTAKGIATWWLLCDETAAQAALDRLAACGLLANHTLASGTIYGLSPSPEIRGWIEGIELPDSVPSRPINQPTRIVVSCSSSAAPAEGPAAALSLSDGPTTSSGLPSTAARQ